MDTIDFRTNWNNKLDCKCFTTFRLFSSKYVTGKPFLVTLKGKAYKQVKVLEIKPLRLDQVNSFIAHIDTGYSVQEFQQMVRTMYKNKINVDTAQFALILLETVKEESDV